jgi:murein DD-endopeptidase MepM/ murein hydrolase activator NlpD
MSAVPCPRCAAFIGLHEGRPHVDSRGTVVLYCATCEPLTALELELMARQREALAVPVCVAPAPRKRSARWLVVPVSASLVGAALASTWVCSGSTGVAAISASAANLRAARQVAVAEPTAMEPAAPPSDVAPPLAKMNERATGVDKWPMPVWDGVRMDEVYPSLRGWIHPVTNSQELVPETGGRRFGAHRDGILRSECGEGHCGVDLDGPRGQPMVSVAAGTIVRVEHSELGRDGRSGRYVRIEHNDGTLTSYMHLDDIAKGLEVGDRVDAGQYIGTLGATAIFSSAPHCHFTLEIPIAEGVHGDHSQTRYVDPSPYLVRAKVVQPMERRENAERW